MLAFVIAVLLLLPVRAGAQQNPDSDLKHLSIEDLLDIDITSVSRKAEPLAETPAAVEVITGEDLRRSGVTTIPEALRLFTGLQVSRFNTGSWAISARGFTTNVSNKLLVKLDGRTVYSPLFAGTFWELQDTVLEDIDRIEVVRGPGASLWESNAVNGIINIITKKSSQTQGSFLRIGGGGAEDLGFFSFRQGNRIGARTTSRVYGKYSYRDQMQFTSGADAKDAARIGRTGFRIDSDISTTDSLTVQGDGYKGELGILGRQDAQESGGNLLARWTRRFSDFADFQLQAYVDHTNRFVALQSGERRTTADIDLQHHFRVGRHDVVWGGAYRVSGDRTDNSAQLSTKFVPASRILSWQSVFAQDAIVLAGNMLSLTVGSKMEHNTYTGFEFQPSVRLALNLPSKQTVWTAVSRAVRTPSRFDTDIQFTPPPLLFQGNPDFKSETVIAYEAGYRTRFQSRVSADVTGFYNVYDNLRSQEQQIPPGTLFISKNTLNATTYGGEITANYDVTEKWRLHGGYSHLWKLLTSDPGKADFFKGTVEGNDAENMFNVRSTMDLPRDFEFDVTARFVGALPSPAVPRYLEWDVRLAWLPTTHLEFSAVGRNLGSGAHPEFGSEELSPDIYGAMNIHF